MKGVLSLLVAAIFSLAAWAFWHYLGSNASSALVTMMLIAVAADNARLRRQLRAKRGE